MKVAIIANGTIRNYEETANLLSTFQTFIAVDGGLNHCLAMEIAPHILIGDLDSTEEELAQMIPGLKILRYPAEKDESDLELALDYLNMELTTEVAIFGGLEGYTDHTLANLYLLPRYGSKIEFWSDRERLVLISGNSTITCRRGQTISLMPLYGPAKIKETKGLKWEIHDTRLDKLFVSLSNVSIENSVEIHVEEGQILASLSDRSERTQDDKLLFE